MLKWMSRMVGSDYCRLEVGGSAIRAVCRLDGRSACLVAQRSLANPFDEAPDELIESISATLADVNDGRFPVRVILDDDLVRYFIVTPPANGSSMTDLRGAAIVRFEGLYGESVLSWQLVADWRARQPFLACAVPRQILDALRLSAATQRSTVVSVTPAFVSAWNRSRRDISVDAWLATLSGSALTLGLVGGASRPRLSAVRSLALQGDRSSTAQICEQVAHAALLEGLPAPVLLHVHDFARRASLTPAGATTVGGITVQWHIAASAICEGEDVRRMPPDEHARQEAVT